MKILTKNFAIALCLSLLVAISCAKEVKAAELEASSNTQFASIVMAVAAASGIYLTYTGSISTVSEALASGVVASYAASIGTTASAFIGDVMAGVSLSTVGTVVLTAAAVALVVGLIAYIYTHWNLSSATEAQPFVYIRSYDIPMTFVSDGSSYVLSLPVVSGMSQGNVYSISDEDLGLYQWITSSDDPGTTINPYQRANPTSLYTYWYNNSYGLRRGSNYMTISFASSYAPSGYSWASDRSQAFCLNGDNSYSVSVVQLLVNNSTQEYAVRFLTDTQFFLSPETITTYDGSFNSLNAYETSYSSFSSDFGLNIDLGTPLEDLSDIVEVIDGSVQSLESISVIELQPTTETDWDDRESIADTGTITPPEYPDSNNSNSPWLPSWLDDIPWHWVQEALEYASSFIVAFQVVMTTVLPASLLTAVYASVVLSICWGVIRRFLE